MSARMIVNNDIAGSAGLEDCGDCVAVATGEDLQINDNLLRIGMAEAEDFVAARFENFLAQLGLRFFRKILIHDCRAL